MAHDGPFGSIWFDDLPDQKLVMFRIVMLNYWKDVHSG